MAAQNLVALHAPLVLTTKSAEQRNFFPASSFWSFLDIMLTFLAVLAAAIPGGKANGLLQKLVNCVGQQQLLRGIARQLERGFPHPLYLGGGGANLRVFFSFTFNFFLNGCFSPIGCSFSAFGFFPVEILVEILAFYASK